MSGLSSAWNAGLAACVHRLQCVSRITEGSRVGWPGAISPPDDAYRKSPVSLIEVPHPVALMRLADCVGFEGVEQVGYRDGFSAVGTGAAEADAGAGLVAVVAPLLAVVAGVAG